MFQTNWIPHANIHDFSEIHAPSCKKFFSADALTHGWTPRSDLNVMLFHDTKDDVVPVENFYAMSQFLKNHGIRTKEYVGAYSSTQTKKLGVTNHEVSALTFFLLIVKWMQLNY